MRAVACVREVREFGVKPEIECFELGHIYFAKQLAKEGIIDDPIKLTIFGET